MMPTRRQKEILEALRALGAERGRGPTLAEIARRVGLASVSTVHKHLELLEARGLLKRRRRGRRREMELLPAARSGAALEVPLLGRIVAGRPIETIAEMRAVALPRDMARGSRVYVLQVRGDSMMDEQILDGDYVVVEERSAARNGEVVVALIEGREATLKTYRRAGGRIRLVPAHPSMAPIEVRPEALRIQGVVIGLLRPYVS
jgi:repressor LexA